MAEIQNPSISAEPAVKNVESLKVEEKKLEDLGLLKPQTKLFVSSLPKETASLVVKYENRNIRISAVVPPQKLKIRILDSDEDGYGDSRVVRCKITTPTLLISLGYADIPIFGRVAVDGNVFLFVLDTKTNNKINTTPYLLSNVHPNGVICWGDLNTPTDLKSAYNMYISSNFTPDLFGVEEDLTGKPSADNIVDHVKKYRTKYLKHQEYDDNTTLICGQKFWAAPKGADAILISDNKSILSQIPSKYWLRNLDGEPLIITLATKQGDTWTFESGSYKFSIISDFITLQPKYNKLLSDTKKKFLLKPNE